MILIKEGVKITGLKPEILLGIQIAASVWKEVGNEDLVITCGTDGVHMLGSFHYLGLAVDLRTRYFGPGTLELVTNNLKVCLGENYDVVVEATHIHLEFNPKS